VALTSSLSGRESVRRREDGFGPDERVLMSEAPPDASSDDIFNSIHLQYVAAPSDRHAAPVFVQDKIRFCNPVRSPCQGTRDLDVAKDVNIKAKSWTLSQFKGKVCFVVRHLSIIGVAVGTPPVWRNGQGTGHGSKGTCRSGRGQQQQCISDTGKEKYFL